MRNECKKNKQKKTLSLRSGMPNISIAKAMLVDRALGSQPGGREN